MTGSQICTVYGIPLETGKCYLILLKGRQWVMLRLRLESCAPRAIVGVDLDNGKTTIVPIAEIKMLQEVECSVRLELEAVRGLRGETGGRGDSPGQAARGA